MRGLTDSSGDILELYAYSPFGKQTILDSTGSEIGVSAVGNNYGYTGRYLDTEVELWHFRARYFSDELGRFTSRDPLGYVDGMNLYNGYFAEGFNLDPLGFGTVIPRSAQPSLRTPKNPCPKGWTKESDTREFDLKFIGQAEQRYNAMTMGGFNLIPIGIYTIDAYAYGYYKLVGEMSTPCAEPGGFNQKAITYSVTNSKTAGMTTSLGVSTKFIFPGVESEISASGTATVTKTTATTFSVTDTMRRLISNVLGT